ncbi:hypothetical protein Franean1_0472 [Parafrankia sp. EAN1pec]|nr:hypothetical protein Franean1_0472 [Frankia sp. EAN1pec]
MPNRATDDPVDPELVVILNPSVDAGTAVPSLCPPLRGYVGLERGGDVIGDMIIKDLVAHRIIARTPFLVRGFPIEAYAGIGNEIVGVVRDVAQEAIGGDDLIGGETGGSYPDRLVVAVGVEARTSVHHDADDRVRRITSENVRIGHRDKGSLGEAVSGGQ